MEELVLNAKKRDKTGKEEANKLRKEGFIPGVVYGGAETLSLSFDEKDLKKILSGNRGDNTIFHLNIEGAENKECNVIVREFQNRPVKNELLHVDFYEVSMDKEIAVTVGIVLEGKAFGVDQEGGMLNHMMKEVEVECLPTSIPDEIKIDVTELKIGDVLHLKDVSMPEGVKLLEDPEEPVISVTMIVEEVIEAPAEEEEGVEGEEAKEEEAKEGEEAKEAKEEDKEAEKPGKDKDEKKK